MKFEDYKRIESQIEELSKIQGGSAQYAYAFGMVYAMLTDDQLKWLDTYTQKKLGK